MVKRFFAVLLGLMLLGSSLGVFAEENFSEEQQPMVVAEVINGEVIYTLNDGNQVEKADFEGVISEKYANEDLYNYLHKAFSEHKEEINVKEYGLDKEKLLAVMKKVIAENGDCSTVVADNCYFVKSGEIIKEIQVIYREMPTESEPELKEDLYEAIREFMISGKQTWIKITDAPLNVANSVDFTDKNYILSVEEMEYLINRVIYLNGEYCWISGNYGWNFYNIGDKKY
ncbi:MAG: hypothetical protein LBM93_11870, partial [Oscillospiraceae bacterium]|nr:hypothetical protein [Oscillospiraceae bacterium]